MPYFRIDDAWWSHPKTLALSPAARDLWCRAGSYSMQHFTDGLISKQALTVLGARPKLCAELVDVGFWEPILGGYQYHDWFDHQDTAENLKDRREKARERMRQLRANRKGEEANSDGERSRERSGNVSDPSPSHRTTYVPETSSVLETSRARGPDEVAAEIRYIEAAIERKVDFRKVRTRLTEQADVPVSDATVMGIIDAILQRAKSRAGDRTGVVLTSLERDWAEWSQLVYGPKAVTS